MSRLTAVEQVFVELLLELLRSIHLIDCCATAIQPMYRMHSHQALSAFNSAYCCDCYAYLYVTAASVALSHAECRLCRCSFDV